MRRIPIWESVFCFCFVFGFVVVFLRRLLYQHSAEIAKIKRGKLLAIDEVIEVKKTY